MKFNPQLIFWNLTSFIPPQYYTVSPHTLLNSKSNQHTHDTKLQGELMSFEIGDMTKVPVTYGTGL